MFNGQFEFDYGKRPALKIKWQLKTTKFLSLRFHFLMGKNGCQFFFFNFSFWPVAFNGKQRRDYLYPHKILIKSGGKEANHFFSLSLSCAKIFTHKNRFILLKVNKTRFHRLGENGKSSSFFSPFIYCFLFIF